MISAALTEQLKLVPHYLGGHMLLTLIALIAGITICIPLGLLITRVKWLQGPVLTVASILQTIPGIALLALMVPLLGKIGFVPALLALCVYSFLPILRNTVTGVLGVDSSVVQAATAMGMTDRQILLRVEIPLALPIIIAGIRTATVWVVGTATLATPVGATSLGNFVFSGLQTQNVTAILVGCTLAALLAIILDQLIRLIEKATTERSIVKASLVLLSIAFLFVFSLFPMLSSSLKSNESGETIVIGSKPFTEQYILAQLLSDHLADYGIETDVRSGMGSMILFEALAEGAVDCYVDYSGTIWTNAMERDNSLPRQEMFEQMSVWLEQEHNINCLGEIGFENTYALAMRQDEAAAKNIKTIDDLALFSSSMTMGSDYEFFQRPEWKSLQESYHLNFNREISMDPTLMYSAIMHNEVDVISAYSTDGRIAANNLVVLSDRKQALPRYDALLLLSLKFERTSELVGRLQKLVGRIDSEAMRQANKMVDVDGESVTAAAGYLRNHIKKK